MKKRQLHFRYFQMWTALLLPSAVLVALLIWQAPDRHNPFTPIDLTDRPGLATRHKLTNVQRHPETCFKALDDADVLYTRLEDSPPGETCGKYDALTLDRSLTPYSATLSMTCAQTATLYMWERHVARPAAIEIFGSPIVEIETYGSFSCRKIARTNRTSEHAHANAIDISGFVLENGRRITVKGHWHKGGPEGAFLKRVRNGACRMFSVTLGPDYNADHADHFHFDMGPGRACR
jgi:hypothetical protein